VTNPRDRFVDVPAGPTRFDVPFADRPQGVATEGGGRCQPEEFADMSQRGLVAVEFRRRLAGPMVAVVLLGVEWNRQVEFVDGRADPEK
jgi:hypothetical protein